MTRKEAIKGLERLSYEFSGYKPNEEMFDMAIKALERESCEDDVEMEEELVFVQPKKTVGKLISVDVLDKIRAEIEYHRQKTQYIDPYDLVGDCLDIIDKYKSESEGNE